MFEGRVKTRSKYVAFELSDHYIARLKITKKNKKTRRHENSKGCDGEIPWFTEIV